MVKLTLSTVLFTAAALLSWTGYRAATAAPTPAPQAAATDVLSTDAAYRHRNNLPKHWRGYFLQQHRF
jgi:hypothetical protein